MAKRQIKASELTGLSIYQDPKKGTIFYDFFTKRAFILTNRDIKTYIWYLTSLPLCIILAYFIMNVFSLDILALIIIIAISYILCEIGFRLFFFYKLPEIQNWVKIKKDGPVKSLAKHYSTPRIIVLLILLISVGIMMIIYSSLENYEGITKIIIYVISIASFIGALLCASALILKNKNK